MEQDLAPAEAPATDQAQPSGSGAATADVEMTGAEPSAWRVLACVNTTAEAEAEPSFKLFSALADIAKDGQSGRAHVEVLENPSLQDLRQAAAKLQPNLVYVGGPLSFSANKLNGGVGAFRFKGERPSEDVLLRVLQDIVPNTVYLDTAVSSRFGPAVQAAGVTHVVVWPEPKQQQPQLQPQQAASPPAAAAAAASTAASPPPINALAASQFNATFFAFLSGCGASVPESFAAAAHSLQAHGTSVGDAGTGLGGSGVVPPPLPALVSRSKPQLPDSISIVLPTMPDVDITGPASLASYPGWSDVRLLAPRAELRMLLCGGSSLINATRLSFLGEALRALLVLEVRALKLVSMEPRSRVPANLPSGSLAVRCRFTSASGAAGEVVLGAPESVLQHRDLVQHALRMTLVADSVSLQFRLPPPGIAPPTARTSAAVAGGVPVVDTLVLTSAWAVAILRTLCQEARSRSLSALGVAAVGNAADPSFSSADVARLTALAAGVAAPPAAAAAAAPGAAAAAANGTAAADADAAAAAAAEPPPELLSAAVVAPDLATAAAHGNAFFGNGTFMGYAINGMVHLLGAGGGGGGAGAGLGDDDDDDDANGDGPGASSGGAPSTSTGEPAADGKGAGDKRPRPVPKWKLELEAKEGNKAFSGHLPGYTCKRPPLGSCSEKDFYDDLVEFLTLLRGKPIERARFPDAVLNAVPLDLFALYREVVSRGGFRVGNGINWKGQVFTRMRNWTESNKQTGVGNALKRHYQNFLWEYEMAHPSDVTIDRCVLCNGGDGEGEGDWVCCDGCENWVHFSCDKRPGIGTFKDYAQGTGKIYMCPTCAKDAPPPAPAPTAAPAAAPTAAAPAPAQAAPAADGATAAAAAPAPAAAAQAAADDGAAGEGDAKRQRTQ